MSKRVLLVDDTHTVRMLEKLMLEREGFLLAEAHDGAQALESIRADRPDLVLMDINMPHMDGIQCCRQIKGDPSLSAIAVIMVSTQGEDARVQEAFSAGCDDFVTKPIRKIELMSKIRRLIGR